MGITTTMPAIPHTIHIPFGADVLEVRSPVAVKTLSARHRPPLDRIGEGLSAAIGCPIGTPSLRDVVKAKGRPEDLSVAVALSDITRPMPYAGRDGILEPLLAHLEACGIVREKILLVIATGMHRASTADEKIAIVGRETADRYAIVDHRCDDRAGLISVGRTASGTPVAVNKNFFSAHVRICTGLVESHFMAGFSGGRKTVCPGLVDRATIERFHGPTFLEDEAATNLILDGNPCHEEAIEVARLVGVDFIVNVTVDAAFRVTGIYAGELDKAHRRACRDAAGAVTIPIGKEYDIVLTHGGYVGRNHYQTAKAAVGAIPVVRKGGTIIAAACNSDPEPVGGPEYRTLLRLLKTEGPDRYVKTLVAPGWRFTKDQWEPEMWGKVIRKVGEEGILYCGPSIPPAEFADIPGVSGYRFAGTGPSGPPAETARLMVQGALDATVSRLMREQGRRPSVAFIADGPYAVPVLQADADSRGSLPRVSGYEK
jgi:nickel-dependent lactate racemase